MSINPRINGWNEASRIALTQSLVEHHSISIDSSSFSNTGDKIFIDGHYYSDKPAVPSMLGALIYFPLSMAGLKLSYGWNLSYYLIILFSVKLFWVFSVIALQRSLRYMGCEGWQCLRTTLIYALASQAFTWSATFNNHSLAASCLILGYSFFLGAKAHGGLRNDLFAGFFFGLAGAVDLPTGLFLLGFGFLKLKMAYTRGSKLSFVLAALLPLGIHGITNFTMSGSLQPLQFSKAYFEFEASPWAGGIHANGPLEFIEYAFISLFGFKGLVWFSPLFIVAIPLLMKHMQEGKRMALESRVIAVSSILLLVCYFLLTQDYGGWSYGIRWFVPLTPLLYLFLFDLEYSSLSRTRKRIFEGLVVYSGIIAVIGLINPWSNQLVSSFPVIANLKQLAQFLFQ